MSYTKKSWSATIKDLTLCFQQWGVTPRQWNVDSALTPAKAANEKQTLEERTVRIWWTRNGIDHNLENHKWPRAVDNLRALYNIIDDLRLAEHRGFQEQAQQYYAQLAAPKDEVLLLGPAGEKTPREVLGLARDATVPMARAAYRELAKKYHTDNEATGDAKTFDEITKAIHTIIGEERR